MIIELIEKSEGYILVLNLFFSAFLTGLIWIIQMVHYPSFLDINRSDFRDYEMKHQKRIGPLVAPVMLIDLAFSFLILFTEIQSTYGFWLWFAFILNLLIFVSTLVVFAPLHQKLGTSYNRNQIKKLVRLNYFRTVGWTARSIILIYVLKQSLV
jgi:hypothetical protein